MQSNILESFQTHGSSFINDAPNKKCGVKAVRDQKGRFQKGNQVGIGHGRPQGAGKLMVKDLCWESINKIALMIFSMPEIEMAKWVEENKHVMSLAERKYLEQAQINLGVIESLLDRIIGKTLKIDSGNTEKNPIIERLYTMSAGNVTKEIDQLIRNRQLIAGERKDDGTSEG